MSKEGSTPTQIEKDLELLPNDVICNGQVNGKLRVSLPQETIVVLRNAGFTVNPVTETETVKEKDPPKTNEDIS